MSVRSCLGIPHRNSENKDIRRKERWSRSRGCSGDGDVHWHKMHVREEEKKKKEGEEVESNKEQKYGDARSV